MARTVTTAAARRALPAARIGSNALVALVSRLLFAQAGASAAVSIGYSRRNVHSVLVAVLIAVVICGLAGLVRSGGHVAWLVAVSFESGFVAAGLFRFAYFRYLGGTLLALITLGTLLHPAVARAFAGWRRDTEHSAVAGAVLAGDRAS